MDKIEVNNDSVRLVEGSNGPKVAGAIYAALTMTSRP